MNFLKILQKMGNDTPNAVLAVIALNCVANATIRPLITLLNPNEQMQRKRYAALRESLTEFIAIPVVVGLGFVFKKWGAQPFLQKQSLEINKDVIQKTSAVLGISTGNIIIPFVATSLIGAVFKVFPSLNSNQKVTAPKPMGNQNFATTVCSVNGIAPAANRLRLPCPYPAYVTFRTTFL